MSLVNDLLIEAERRRASEGAPRRPHLEDLIPTRTRSTESTGARRSRGGLLGVAAIAGLAVGAAAYLGGLEALFEIRDLEANTPPPVAARPDSPSSGVLASRVANATTSATPFSATAERPVRVESISLERLSDTTRLRIVADGRAAHRLEHDSASDRIELVLGNTALTEPTEPIDLLDTPIRTLELRAESPDLRLLLALDAEVHTQTRWLALEQGAALIVDLQARPKSRPIDTRASFESDWPDRMPLPRVAPVGAARAEIGSTEAAVEAEAEVAFDAEESVELSPSLANEIPEAEALLASIAPEGADRIDSPSLGDPATMRIEPSQQAQRRAERAGRRAQREGLLASARHARKSGRLDDADAQYAEIVSLAPNDPTPIAEWADVLVLQDRIPEALALIDSARERAPRDQALLITKAQLLERTGDITGAILLLDQSGLALTEAPDVHALAAAYQQRAGRHESAIERYEQILRRFPEESRSWLGLGISLEAVGRKREARDVYRISLSVGELPGGTRHWVTGRLSALGEKD